MAQYYQIQNLDDLKQIYADVQVVHVASEDAGVGGHTRPQQLLLPEDQLMLNEGQQVVYQTANVPAQQQYQQQPAASTTQYIIGDEISQQQQAVQHQQQVMYDHHHQQQQQQHYVHESQQMPQDHHQLAQQTQQQQQPQLYYTTEPILQPNSLVQQQQQQEMQHQQQQQQQLHVQQQQYQQQQQQQIVHQQHTIQAPQQPQQIVYRMQTQQPQTQQTQMLNNAHVILQQPSGQQVLIQSPQHSEIIMRQPMPQQRIIYNTNRVLYSPQQQQQPQTQAVLQQSPQSHQQHPQQQQQHIQLQTSSTTTPMHTTARLVQTRVGASPQETVQQHQQPQPQQNVVFHPIQATAVQNPQQLKPQLQQQSQLQIQQQPQQQLVAAAMTGGVSGGGVMRGAIRNKSPRGGGALGGTHTLIARMPAAPVSRAVRPQMTASMQPQLHQQAPRTPRPRGGAGGTRARGAARGGRGGASLAGRGTQVTTTIVQQQQQSQQLQSQQQISTSQQLIQNAVVQGKNITILNPQGQVKHIYRNIAETPQQQLRLLASSAQQQQRATQLVGARFRAPIVTAGSGAGSSNSSGSSSGNYELDLEDSIQAVVVKKDQQKPAVSTANITNPVGTTLTSYYTKEDDDTRLVRTQNGTCITLAEYRKRHPPTAGSSTTTTATILQMKAPLRASGPQPPNKMLPTHASGSTGMVPIARVAPQQVQQPQQSQQSQIPTTTSTSSSAVHRTSHNNYEIHTQHVMQNRNNTQMAEKDRNSAKMLVILVSGEQRLITFTLPRESCTVQDLLEQVGVPFDSSTTIQCVENPGANIDFVVTVGFSVQESASELISRAEQTLQMNRQQDATGGSSLAATNAASVSSGGNTTVSQGTIPQPTSTASYGNPPNNAAQTANSTVVPESAHKDAHTINPATTSTTNKSSTAPAATEEVPRKIIQGFLAVCQSCGFSGYDHAKCERCKRVFLDPPKRVPCVKSLGSNTTSTASETTVTKAIGSSELTTSEKRRASDILARAQAKNALSYSNSAASSGTSTRGRGGPGGAGRGRSTRSGRRAAEIEPVILTLSSDEEDDDESSNKAPGSFSSSSNAANSTSCNTKNYEPLGFETTMPDVDENAVYADFQRDDVTDLSNCSDKLSTTLQCKVVRIGTYRFEPKDPVTFTSKGVCLVAPLVTNPNESFPLHIHKREVVKIIAHFSKVSESMLCFYTLRNCAQYIKNSLQMKDNGAPLDGCAYFSPNGPYQVRKIILQFSACSDQSRNVIKSIWDFFDEISDVDAHDLLQRAEAADRHIANKTTESTTSASVTTTQLNPNEIRQLLIYPPGKGGISINTEDYLCLATDQYLNDIIIDFYLKWVHNNVIPQTQRDRAFIFSTFFYKRLTTLTRHHHNVDKDVKQTAAQKRHARVQNWTKNVNLFEKDFIIIPINEQSHWFLAIICFPTLKGPVTYDTNIPVEPQLLKKQKGKKVSLQIGNTTITPLSKRDSGNILAEVCGVGDDDSERDEAEGDESDLASEESDFDSGTSASAVSSTANASAVATNNNSNNGNTGGVKSQAIKQPLILIFDSLAGASRSRVVATLRDYLTCEYRAKMPDVTPHIFNKDNMPGHGVKVPQQNNFTDCGLYLLQYVEQFFKDPIRDYRVPIKQLSNWFDTITVTRKREDISQLLQQLMNERNGPNHQVILPEIPLPTLNGILVEPPEGYNIEFEEEETGEDVADEDDDNTASTSADGAANDADGTASSAHTEELVSVKVPTTKALTTTAVVPTQGRKIVVKRRMQLVSATAGSSNSETLATTTSAAAGIAGQSIRSGNQAKYRKFE